MAAEVASKTDEVLDFEPDQEMGKGNKAASDVAEEDLGTVVSKLRCPQCEFLKFKNVDQWKNHVVGHWRLAGMKADYEISCFVEDCDLTPKDEQFEERLEELAKHFVKVHKFEQEAYRKCDICIMEFTEERKYNSHMRKHDESFTCDLCQKKLTGKFWFEKHIKDCVGDDRPKWAQQNPVVAPGEDREVLEIYGKEYDVYWGTVTNTYTNVERIVARSWIEGKAWAGKGATRDEARSKLIKYLKDHVKKTMDAGLYQLEEGELVPEPTLTDPGNKKLVCNKCGTQFSKKTNLDLHMFMHRNK